jgi:hypothetical protein
MLEILNLGIRYTFAHFVLNLNIVNPKSKSVTAQKLAIIIQIILSRLGGMEIKPIPYFPSISYLILDDKR